LKRVLAGHLPVANQVVKPWGLDCPSTATRESKACEDTHSYQEDGAVYVGLHRLLAIGHAACGAVGRRIIRKRLRLSENHYRTLYLLGA
jgi:hypothetical protein